MESIIKQMRAELVPLGKADLVILRTKSAGIVMPLDFVKRCIDALERITIRAAIGEPQTNMEKLAYELLKDSAHIGEGDSAK